MKSTSLSVRGKIKKIWMKRIREREGGGWEREGERETGRGGWVTFFKGINKLSECSCSAL